MFNFHHFGRGRSGRVGGQGSGRTPVSFAARIVAALSILAGGALLAWAPAGPAAAAVGGSISGTVTVPAGYDVTDVLVYLVNPVTNTTIGPGTPPPSGGIHPAGSGAYSFTGVAPGTYAVFAESYLSGLAWQWWDAGRDASEAESFSIVGGSTVAGIDFDLVVGGTITGTITVPDGWAPDMAMASVDRPEGSPLIAPAGSLTKTAGVYDETDVGGVYSVGGLPDLSWRVRFSYMGHWLAWQMYDHAYRTDLATPVDVTLGATTPGIDADMEVLDWFFLDVTLKDPASELCYTIKTVDEEVLDQGCTTDFGHAYLVPPRDYLIGVYERNITYGVTPTMWWNGTPTGTSDPADAVLFTPPSIADDSLTATFDLTNVPWYVEPGVLVVAGTPVRIADLSDFTAGVVRCVPVVGLADVPAGAVGVLFNVTAAGATGPGNVVVYPDFLNNGASPPPNASTVNFEPGADVANSATVALPTNGQVCAFSQGAPLSRLILDVTGYILPGSGITLQNSVRLVDTRGGGYHVGSIVGPVEPQTPYTVQVTGNAGVPAGATAVFANVTVTGVTSGGHLRMWAAGTPMPNTSVVNYAPGQDKANGQIIALSADGQLSFASMTGAGTASNPVQVIIDVVGYVEAGAQFVGTAPTRVVETRAEYGTIGPIPGPLTPVTVYPVRIGTSLVPISATAVVLNVTAVGPTGPGHLRVYPDTNGAGTTPPPDTSNINYIPGRDIPNMITVQLPADRIIDFYNVQGGSNRTNLVVDVIGYIDGSTS